MTYSGSLRSAVLAGVALMALSPSAASAIELRFSHPFTEDDTRHRMAEFIAEEMAARTDGEVTVAIYPNQQLFKAREQYDGLRTSQIDFAIYPMPWLSGRVPAANIGVLPGVVESAEDALDWRNREVWDLLAERVEEADVRMVSIFWDPATYATTGDLPRTPEEMARMQVRGMGAPLEVMLQAEGASITSMPAADTYFAMQTGALDALFSTLSSFAGYNMQEVVGSIARSDPFVAGGHFILMSNRGWESLTEEQQQVLDEVMTEAEANFVAWAAEQTDATYQAFADAGVEIVDLSPEDMEAWREAAREYSWPYFAESVEGGQEILDAIGQPRQ